MIKSAGSQFNVQATVIAIDGELHRTRRPVVNEFGPAELGAAVDTPCPVSTLAVWK